MPDHSTRMRPRLAGLAILAAITAGASSGAQAQPFFGYFGSYRTYSVPETLSPELVYRQLTRSGFQPLGRIQRNGDVFLADVIDPRRRQLRLVIDRMDGSILERYVIAPRVSASLEDPIRRPTMRIPDEPGYAPAPEPRKQRKASAPNPRVIPAPIPPSARTPAAPRNEPAIAEGPAAMAPAPLPITPAPTPIERAPSPPPTPRADGPGYANGVPINPLE